MGAIELQIQKILICFLLSWVMIVETKSSSKFKKCLFFVKNKLKKRLQSIVTSAQAI
jgi:hypothetical protein